MIPLPLIGLALQAAPSLVSLITGSDKAEDITQKTADVFSAVTGIDVGTADGAQRAADALETDPALMAQLTLNLRSVEADELKVLQKDVAEARRRDVDVMQMNGGQNWRANLMIIGAFLMLLTCVGGIVYVSQTDLNAAQTSLIQGPLGIIIGFLVKVLGDAFNFEFGSSRGSKQKAAQLDRLIPAMNDGAPESVAKAVTGAFRSLR